VSRPSAADPSPWRGAGPELVVAAAALVATTLSAYALAGVTAAALVAVIFAALALAGVSRLLPPAADTEEDPWVTRQRPPPSFVNHWRLRSGLSDAMMSMAAYNVGLGPKLEHLLAARLAERHGVSLYREPEKARRILCSKAGDADLWSWVDPGRPPTGPGDAPGIPARALSRLVRRMEEL
jgi:hypothetical protein